MTTTRESKRIDKVTVKRIADYDADLSDLGEFSDKADSDFAIVAVGEFEGDFVSDLPCECGLAKSEHTECNGQTIGEPCELGEDHCCEFDRVEIRRGRDFSFFNSASVEDGNTDETNREYAQQDYKRIKAYDAGEWRYYGVKAEAEISIPISANSQVRGIQTIRSGGLWGIESDSEESYFEEIEKEELSQLRDQLHALGFSKRAISAAFRNVKHQD